MSSKSQKTLTIMSGPNGAGKTTFAKRNFPDLIAKGLFLNADHLADDMNPDNVSKVAITAGKHFLNELDDRLRGDESFVIETTLSGKTLLRKIESAQQQGFVVRLIFLWLRTTELCDFRVKMRVTEGGHNIPFDDIIRRHARGLQNLPAYIKAVDEYEIFQANEKPILVAHKDLNTPVLIGDKTLYEELNNVMG